MPGLWSEDGDVVYAISSGRGCGRFLCAVAREIHLRVRELEDMAARVLTPTFPHAIGGEEARRAFSIRASRHDWEGIKLGRPHEAV